MTEIFVVLFLLAVMFGVFKIRRYRHILDDLKKHANKAQMIVFCKTDIVNGMRYHKIDKVWKGAEYLFHVSNEGYLGESVAQNQDMKFGAFSIHFIFLKKTSDKYSIGVGSNALYEHKGKYQLSYNGRNAWVSLNTFGKVIERCVA
jgi:hypothetical protein